MHAMCVLSAGSLCKERMLDSSQVAVHGQQMPPAAADDFMKMAALQAAASPKSPQTFPEGEKENNYLWLHAAASEAVKLETDPTRQIFLQRVIEFARDILMQERGVDEEAGAPALPGSPVAASPNPAAAAMPPGIGGPQGAAAPPATVGGVGPLTP